MSKCRIFVYGTLRRGFGNNVLIRNQTFIGEAITHDRHFALIDSFGLPFVVRTNKTSKYRYRIGGEVWEIDQRTLAAVDQLESNGSLYQREKIRTSVGKAWMYLGITDSKGFLGLIKPSEEVLAPADDDGVQLWDPHDFERRCWWRMLDQHPDDDDLDIPFELDAPTGEESDESVVNSRDWTGAPS